ncbi:hypothetical protein VTJ49DRAFT_1550 [Mycothermus thermophilus]|uniref:Uncharacterized protein n=1 Tax=Humicola insolens TaxID=85995 RepID=A0ABR3VNQ3_HUMIN
MARRKVNHAKAALLSLRRESEPYWGLDGFDFSRMGIPDSGPADTVLYSDVYTTGTPESGVPTAAELARVVSNNVTVLFRALIFFRDGFGSKGFWVKIRKYTFKGTKANIRQIVAMFVRARKFYLESNDSCSTETTRVVDEWIAFEDSLGDGPLPGMTTKFRWAACYRRWKKMIRRDKLMDCGQPFAAPSVEASLHRADELDHEDAGGPSTHASELAPIQSGSKGKRPQSRSPTRSPPVGPKRRRYSPHEHDASPEGHGVGHLRAASYAGLGHHNGSTGAGFYQQRSTSAYPSFTGPSQTTHHRIERNGQADSQLGGRLNLPINHTFQPGNQENRTVILASNHGSQQGRLSTLEPGRHIKKEPGVVDHEAVEPERRVPTKGRTKRKLEELTARVDSLENKLTHGNAISSDRTGDAIDEDQLLALDARVTALSHRFDELEANNKWAINDIYRRLYAVELNQGQSQGQSQVQVYSTRSKTQIPSRSRADAEYQELGWRSMA